MCFYASGGPLNGQRRRYVFNLSVCLCVRAYGRSGWGILRPASNFLVESCQCADTKIHNISHINIAGREQSKQILSKLGFFLLVSNSMMKFVNSRPWLFTYILYAYTRNRENYVLSTNVLISVIVLGLVLVYSSSLYCKGWRSGVCVYCFD